MLICRVLRDISGGATIWRANASRLVRSWSKARAGHGTTGYSRDGVLILDGRFWVHALLWSDVTQLRVGGWLHEVLCAHGSAGVVADQVKMLTGGCGDAERLLHQTIGLVAIAVGTVLAVVLTVSRRVLLRVAGEQRGRHAASSTLSLHLTIGQEASRYTAGTPGLAVSPPPHACLALVPDKDGTRFDGLSFLLGQTSLDPGKEADPTGFEQNDGIAWSPDVAVIGFHVEPWNQAGYLSFEHC